MGAFTSDGNFEKSLSDLAFASLQDKTPALLQHLLGFQILDSNEDQTQAVGVFGCKVGEEYVYVPIFFMNGQLKDGLMYLKNQDIFVPQSEVWVSYILNRKPYKIGDKTQFTNKDLAINGPDLLRFRNTPRLFGKSASAVSKRPPDLYKHIKLGNHTESVPVWNSSSIHEWFEPIDLRLRSAGSFSELHKKAADNLDLVNFFSGKPLQFVKQSMLALAKNEEAFTSLVELYGDRLKKIAAVKEPEEKKDTPVNRVTDLRIVSYKDIDNPYKTIGMTDAEKKRLIMGEIVIKDHRKNTSNVYAATVPTNIVSPDRTGVYDILLNTGELTKAFVINSPLSFGCDFSNKLGGRGIDCFTSVKPTIVNAAVVYLDEDGAYIAPVNKLYGTPANSTFLSSNFIEEFKELDDAFDMKEGSSYCLVNSAGSGTEPFHVLKVKEREDGSKTFFVTTSLRPGDHIKDEWFNQAQILITAEPRRRIAKIGDVITAGKNCKAVKIKVGGGSKDFFVPNNGAIPPGDLQSVEHYLISGKKAVPLKIYTNGSEYQITAGTQSSAIKTASMVPYREALTQLVYTYGIKGDVAQNMLKQADHDHRSNKAIKFFVKFAEGYPALFKEADDPYLTGQGPTAPAMFTPNISTYDPEVSVPSMGPIMEAQPVQGMIPHGNNVNLYNPNPALDTHIYDTINNAAQTGQKEVFDTAVIAGLVNSNDSGDLIDKYVGDLILGMDRVGRIYFLFLSHNDEFKSRYGQSDMIELEDSLKNVFRSLGDLVMFLKQKTVEKSKLLDRTKIETMDTQDALKE